MNYMVDKVKEESKRGCINFDTPSLFMINPHPKKEGDINLLHLVNNSLESFLIVDSEISKHLTIDLDAGLV